MVAEVFETDGRKTRKKALSPDSSRNQMKSRQFFCKLSELTLHRAQCNTGHTALTHTSSITSAEKPLSPLSDVHRQFAAVHKLGVKTGCENLHNINTVL